MLKSFNNYGVTSFTVNNLFVLDLRDDFLMNDSKKLYDFIGKDPVKAFHLGIHVSKWFELLDKKQQYLHSKLLRHNQEDVESYMEQLKHWTEVFPHSSKDDQIDMIKLSEYVFNNIIWDLEDEDGDQVKVALFLGIIVGKNSKLEDEQALYSVH